MGERGRGGNRSGPGMAAVSGICRVIDRQTSADACSLSLETTFLSNQF